MSVDGVSALERGYRRTPHRETLTLLAGALTLNDEERLAFQTAAARWKLLPSQKESSVTVGPWERGGTSDLPLALTSFVGREVELAEIAALVRDHRLVTVTGPGGVGKTQTALRATAILSEVPDVAVCFTALAPLRDPSLVVTAVASTLGLQEVPNYPLLDSLMTYLKNKSMLLILDNCEHVMVEVRAIAEALLLDCPRVKILVTSRESLRVAGERAYRLPSLSVPSAEEAHSISAEGAVACGAIALFADRARAVDHRFKLTDENAPIVAELCRGLDGIPLAIELAAARVKVLTPRQITQRLDQRFRLLTGGDPGALPRHQTMTALIDWSYDLLSGREQRFFEYLSVFADGFELEAATAVCAIKGEDDLDVIDLITSLVAKSLLVAEMVRGEQRYWLSESSRQYAWEKLSARGEGENVARCHALACVDLSERLERAWETSPELVLSRSKAEVGNWRTSLDWALRKRGDVLLGQRLVAARRVMWRSLTLAEARHWVQAALASVDEHTPPELVARLDLADAYGAAQFGEPNASLAAAQRALVRYRELGDVFGVAQAQRLAGGSLVDLGRFADGEAMLREALVAARILRNRRLEVSALAKIGSARSGIGDFVGARAHFTEALELADPGAEYFIVASSLALNEHNAGDAESALRLLTHLLSTHCAGYSSSLSQTASTNIPRANIATNLVNIAEFLIVLGRYDEARAQANEALEFARGLHLDVAVAAALENVALVAVLRSQAEAASPSEDYTRAARLLGFVGVRRNDLGFEACGRHKEYYRALAVLRDVIGAEEVTRLILAGATITQDEAIAQAYALGGS